MSFAQMHNDYLDPDRAGLNDEQPYQFENEWPEQAEEFFWFEDGKILAMRGHDSDYYLIGQYDGDDVLEAKQVIFDYFNKIEAEVKLIEAELKLLDGPTYPPQTWKEFWDGMADHFPQVLTGEEFCYPNECDVETVPEYDDDKETYEPAGYGVEYGRDDAGLYIRAERWDGLNLDWDQSQDEIREEDGEKEFVSFQAEYLGTDHYFRQWTNYFCWCALNGAIDPVDTYYRRENCTHADLVKSARDNLKYLKMNRKEEA
jgi:hypothetical protein